MLSRLNARLRRFSRKSRIRTPTVLQMEAVECGAASLAMVLAFYGRWVSLEELRVDCGVSRDGARASNVLKAARHHGLDAKGLKLELAEVLKQEFPVIVFWNFNHFLVVEGSKAKAVFVNDPASGPRKLTMEEFSRGYTGVALVMRPGERFHKGGGRRSLFAALASRLRGSQAAFSVILIVTLMLIVPGLLLPAFIQSFTDDVLIRGFKTWVLPIILGLLLTGVLASVVTYLQQKYLLRVQVKLALTSAGRFFWHVLRVPVVFYTQRSVGDVAAREQSCERIASLLAGPVSTNLVNMVMILFYAVVMIFYSPVLTALVIQLALLNVIAAKAAQRKLKDLNSHLLNQQAKLSGAGMSGLQAIETLKASGAEQEFFKAWSGYQTDAINTQQRLGIVSSLLNSAPSALTHLSSGLILGVGGWLIIHGQLTIGGLFAFQLLAQNFIGPIQQMVGFTRQIQETHGDLTRLDDVERYPLDTIFQPEQDSFSAWSGGALSGAVEMNNVSFGYSPLDPPLINEFNLTLHPGSRVALVGATGSGKSTLAKLLLGLYRPSGGEILFDGQPIDRIPRTLFTQSVAMVAQEIFLFEGSIHDNLTMWDPTVPHRDLIQAARDACIHEVVASRPGGYSAPVSEGGTNFSGGQAQRLEIARSLVRNPSILVLDEATASLDTMTEKTIDDNLRKRGCTCIIVAHRLSTIRDCDEIIVLDHGVIAQRGTHDDLMRGGGIYQHLVASA